ncbi:CHRD domain-containing protein [Oculatella sp. LEGE 06141]|uniref:CHRD domain-containing protein n=1 Tax=Oculatella sp. LEGE 06141 TaxID=1828648 RepID=UPI00187E565B|nr:CHRD domain-containing protein [Oculatella sp. LEGE 06141]MBE9182499.1 CHRD domain-containing protein [Oculatella sp. LEGE 06141]
MNKARRILVNVVLGAVTCLFCVGLSSPLMGTSASPTVQSSLTPSNAAPFQRTVERHLAQNLQNAESAIVAQGMTGSTMTRYVAVMTKEEVVPSTPSTFAFGAAGAVLMGDRLIIRGDFSNLASPLRDFATDPVDPPNPNITSGIHIHQGDVTVNGPFQYALNVDLGNNETTGRFSGEYTLTGEQLQALSNGMLYVDIHTAQNRGGELRGILQPY